MPNATPTDRKTVDGRSIRWNAQRAAAAYDEGLWTTTTLANSLRTAAQKTPERIVLVDGDTRLDCKTLLEQAESLAQSLLARAPSGSVVSFTLPNWHEAAVIYLGATLAGMVVNPILPSLRDRELQFILGDVDSRFVFIPERLRKHDYSAMLDRVCQQLPNPPQVVVVRGEPGPHAAFTDWMDETPAPVPLPQIDPDAVRMIMYTSGTTGRPKGVLHTHNSIHALMCQLREHWLVDPGDRFLVPSPIAHIGGSIYAFEAPLLLGTTAVLMEQWSPDAAVALMQAEACTHMAGATPFLEQVLAAAERANTQLPHLKLFVCGGAAVPPSLIRRAQAFFDRAIVTRVYGSTEVPVTTVGATRQDEAELAADTDGRGGIAELKLCGHSAARGDEGEICARGPQMLAGYLHPEDETDAFDAQGFFRAGDIARWVDGRYLVVTGRAKDIIIRKGENISPKEVEDILIGHPDIAEIAIIGLADPRSGERACAVVVAEGNARPDVTTLSAFLKEHGLAMFKAPEQVELVDALPKNDAGKVLKHQLRARFSGSR